MATSVCRACGLRSQQPWPGAGTSLTTRTSRSARAAFFQAVANNAFRILLAGFRANSIQRINTLRFTALRAHGAIRPDDAFHHLESRCLVMEVHGIENRHDTNPSRF